jgi:hypothetical protein
MKVYFQAEKGWFGEHGWVNIKFRKWFWMFLEGGWCIRLVIEF